MKKNTNMLIIYVCVLFIWPFIISAMLELIMMLAREYKITIITEDQGLVIVNLSTYLILLIATWKTYGCELKVECQKLQSVKRKTLFAFGLGLWFTNLIIDNVVSICGTEISDNQEIVNKLSATNYFVSLIIFVFIGPVVEEIIFRYIIMNQFNGKIISVLISASLFGLLHISSFDLGEFLMYFTSGIYLGIIYLKTNNIMIPISAHIVSNLINMVLMAIIIVLT